MNNYLSNKENLEKIVYIIMKTNCYIF